MDIVETHVHVFTEDRTPYPRFDTARAGAIPGIRQKSEGLELTGVRAVQPEWKTKWVSPAPCSA